MRRALSTVFKCIDGFSFCLKVLWRDSQTQPVPLLHETFTVQPVQKAASVVDGNHELNEVPQTGFKPSIAIELDQLEYKATNTRANP